MFIHKVFHIDSSNRLSGSHEDMTIALDLKDHDVNRCCVLQAQIPNSHYHLRDGFNHFTLTELGGDTVITVPIGNYTRRSLKYVLSNLLTESSPNGWTYSLTIPNANEVDLGKYTFTVTGNSSNQPSFTFTDVDIAHMMGFCTTTTNAFVADVLVSTCVIKMSIVDTIYIRSDLCGGSADDIIQEVHTSGIDFDYTTFENTNPTMFSRRLSSHHHSSYRFRLTNDRNEILDLNGLNWTITVCSFHSGDFQPSK